MPKKIPHVTNQMFLNCMFQDMPEDTRAILATFDGDPNDESGDRRWKWKAKPWQLGQGAWQIPKEQNNYFAISVFKRDQQTGRFRRTKTNIVQLCAVMIDDIGTKVPKTKIKLPLTATIETSPGNFQGFYRIKPSPGARDLETALRLLDQMVKSGLTADGSDPGMKGVTRYGRLPSGVNGKIKYVEQLGAPFVVRATQWNPERAYTAERIAKAFGLNISAPPKREPLPVPPGAIKQRTDEFNSLLQALGDAGLYLASRGGWHDIECPWIDQHTDRGATGTSLVTPSAANRWAGGFRCHHGHCQERSIRDLYAWQRAFDALQEEEV